MRDSIEKPNNPTIYSHLCKVSAGEYFPNIHPDAALGVTDDCENEFREDVITCKTPQKEAFIEEVGGLDFDTVILNTTVEKLPFYIPILDKRSSRMSTLPKSDEFVGVTLSDILKRGMIDKSGGFREQENIIDKKILQNKAFKGKKVILFMSGRDILIEGVWNQRHKTSFYATIKSMGFYAVTGINFSVMIGECPLGQYLNLKRSLHSAAEAQDAGLIAIPHVYAVTNAQADKWIEWFRKNPAVKIFTMNCQFQKSKAMNELTVRAIKRILSAVPSLRILVQGFKANYIRQLNGYLDRINFADAVPSKFSQVSLRVIPEGISKMGKFDRKSSYKKLFTRNLSERIKILEDRIASAN